MRFREVWTAFVLLVFTTLASLAQQTPFGGPSAVEPTDKTNAFDARSWKFARGAKEIEFDAGLAPMQPTFFSGRKEYDTAGRRFLVGSLRFGRVIGTLKGVTYQYIFDSAPLAIAINNEVRNPRFDPGSKTSPRTLRENTPALFNRRVSDLSLCRTGV